MEVDGEGRFSSTTAGAPARGGGGGEGGHSSYPLGAGREGGGAGAGAGDDGAVRVSHTLRRCLVVVVGCCYFIVVVGPSPRLVAMYALFFKGSFALI